MSFLEFRASLFNLELEHFATPEAERIAKSETSQKEKQFIEAVTFEQASFGNSVILNVLMYKSLPKNVCLLVCLFAC
jgi:hypothetical protein